MQEANKNSWPIVGNGHIIDFLTKSLVNKNIAGCYIFTGPEQVGKTAAANYFAKSLVCLNWNKNSGPCKKCASCNQAEKSLHSDIYTLEKLADKKNISIEQVREFIRNLSMSSFLNSYKIGIIKGAENLNLNGVNALLKTLEEPKAKVVIILIVSDPELLPKTILSRGQILRFKAVASDEIYDDLVNNHLASRSQAKNFSRLAAGRPELAMKFLNDKEYLEDYKIRALAFFDFLSQDLNERFKAITASLEEKKDSRDAGELIEIWQSLARDLMLAELDLNDLIEHEIFEDELARSKKVFGMAGIINLINSLKEAKEHMSANVNPKLALEKVAVSL